MNEKNNWSWEALSSAEQEKYIQQASYLIKRGYILDEKDVFVLAKKIYIKTNGL